MYVSIWVKRNVATPAIKNIATKKAMKALKSIFFLILLPESNRLTWPALNNKKFSSSSHLSFHLLAATLLTSSNHRKTKISSELWSRKFLNKKIPTQKHKNSKQMRHSRNMNLKKWN